MKLYNLLVLAIFIMTIGFYSCSYYVHHDFQKNYARLNEVLHSDTTTSSFFKVHLKNGDVSILNHWHLNTQKDSILGKGILYDFKRFRIQEGHYAFQIEDIAIIQTNQLEAIKSKGNAKIVALSILTGINIPLDIYCMVNPKACMGSCPSFYTDHSENIHVVKAEGFSNAIAPALEKKDIDALNYSCAESTFSITMKNEALETHMLNELSIHAVLKKKNEKIYHDKEGNYYSCGMPYPCKTARQNNRDIKTQIKDIDEKEYFSAIDTIELATQEEILIEFDRTSASDLALVLNFRQSLLPNFLVSNGLSYLGNEVGNYFAQIETKQSAQEMLVKPFEHLGGIKLYVWDNGQWSFFEELHETGSISKNLMLAPLPKLATRAPKVKIKVEMTKGLWRLDYLALSPIHAKANPYISSPYKVEILDGEDYSFKDVQSDDDLYLVAFPGNEFKFNFHFPEIEQGSTYELFLSTKGYYLKWIRQSWLKTKNLTKLKKMLSNDPVIWQTLAQEFKSREHELEI